LPANNNKLTERRRFIKNAALAGTAVLGTGEAAAAVKTPERRLRIGVMGAKPSFISYSWSDLMEPDKEPNNMKRGNFGTPFLNMNITHVWDVNPVNARAFAERMNAKVVKDYDGMVGLVDGVVFGGINEVPWQHRLARPYIEAGIPTYLSRPFAFSIRDIDDILECAAKHGTPIMATAKYEHYNEAPALREKLKNIGIINCVHATGWSRDFPMHFHIQFMMLKILGYDVGQVSVITDNAMRNKYLQETFLFNGWEGQPPYLCSIQAAPNQDQFTVTIVGSETTVTASMLRSPHWRDSLLFRYAPQVIDMQRTFEGKLYEPLDNIRKKTEIFLTGYYSHLERGGAPVDVGTVSVDWHAPSPKPGWIDESIFKR
jgi:predicted dehydrogenase